VIVVVAFRTTTKEEKKRLAITKPKQKVMATLFSSLSTLQGKKKNLLQQRR
jgi:hypothetical protein